MRGKQRINLGARRLSRDFAGQGKIHALCILSQSNIIFTGYECASMGGALHVDFELRYVVCVLCLSSLAFCECV